MSISLQTMANPSSFFIIPTWLYRTIVKNKLNLIDVIDYKKARKIFSTHDLAELFFINTNDRSNPFRYLSSSAWDDSRPETLDFFFDNSTITAEEMLEIRHTVIPLSQSAEIASSVKGRFEGTPPNGVTDYSFIPVNNGIIFTILNEGILKSLLDPEYMLNFMRSCLKQQYSVDTIASVSNNATFEKYLNLLLPTVIGK